MNKIIRNTVLITFLLLAVNSFAETQDENTKSEPYLEFPSALGVYGSSIINGGAFGLQYQHWFNSWGLQIYGGALYNPQDNWGRTLDYSIMFEGQRAVYGSTFSDKLSGRLYTWIGIGHHGFIPADDVIWEDGEKPEFERGCYVPNAIAAAGIGIEIILFEHFSLPLQFGYTAEFPNMPGIGFTVGSGLRYRY